MTGTTSRTRSQLGSGPDSFLRAIARLLLCAALSSALPALAFGGPGQRAPAFDACFDIHGSTYGVDPQLLRALARTESSMNPAAINRSHVQNTGSVDIGVLQINSRWLPFLSQYGIQRVDLDDACTNIEVGAWILSDLLRKRGNSWDAVGAWNAACTQLKGDDCTSARARFAWKVYRHLQALPPAQLTAARPLPSPGLIRVAAVAPALAATVIDAGVTPQPSAPAPGASLDSDDSP